MFIRLHISLNSGLQTTETDSHEPKRKLLEDIGLLPEPGRRRGPGSGARVGMAALPGSCLEPFGRCRLCPRDRHPALTLSTVALAIQPWCHK